MSYTLIPIHDCKYPYPKITDVYLNEREIDYLQRHRQVIIAARPPWELPKEAPIAMVKMDTVVLHLMRDYGHIHQRIIVVTNSDREVLDRLSHERECEHWADFWEN